MTSAIFSRLSAPASKVLLVALLALPALYVPEPAGEGENRKLAPVPTQPSNVAELLAYPAGIDAWINDHFGLRDQLVRLNTRLRYRLFGELPGVQAIKGKDGRVFLSAYQPTAKPYSGILAVCGYQSAYLVPEMVRQINRLTEITTERGINARLLVVPSAPAVQKAQLPDWLAALCVNDQLPMNLALASGQLTPQARERLYFPLAEMQSAAAKVDLFPRTFFHWGGAGPRLVTDLLVPQFAATPGLQGTPAVSASQQHPSDIRHLFPGIRLYSSLDVLDEAASGIEACRGPACFAEMTPVFSKFGEVGHYRNPKAPLGRLVLISDSFGPPSWPWFARFYKEVVAVNINGIDSLDEADRAKVRAFLFQGGTDDQVLVMYHDATVYAERIKHDFSMLMPGF